MVSAVASEDSEILFFRPETLTGILSAFCSLFFRSPAKSSADFHAEKLNFIQSNFLHHPKNHSGTSFLIYLTAQAMRANSTVFEIPFDRQQMADYLNLSQRHFLKNWEK